MTDQPGLIRQENTMRIHTTIANVNDIYDALRGQQALGRIAKHVSFKTLNEHRSSVMPHAYEIQLEAEVRDCGRRAGNSGSYGAMRPESDGYAATYDEWGWLLRSLFLLDPNMIVGSVKSPVYANAVAFHRKTAWTYAPELLIDALENGDDPFPYITGRAAKTKRGYFLGRRGADRHAVEPFWPHVERPRTIDEVRAFAYPLEVTA
ncbi:hypothetical protein SEA_ZAGIE_90 [Microbacterium phage Zagie]|nr:hypothetical protein SEA_ZAGIE_90 [Microbacterium phage Zagie]